MTHELFHAISDEGSAAARRLVTTLQLEGVVRFRNVAYPEVEADLYARGGRSAPALWNGDRLVEGADDVLPALRELALSAGGPDPFNR